MVPECIQYYAASISPQKFVRSSKFLHQRGRLYQKSVTKGGEVNGTGDPAGARFPIGSAGGSGSERARSYGQTTGNSGTQSYGATESGGPPYTMLAGLLRQTPGNGGTQSHGATARGRSGGPRTMPAGLQPTQTVGNGGTQSEGAKSPTPHWRTP